MFSKMYYFVLTIMCDFFFGNVLGNTLLINTNEIHIEYPIDKNAFHNNAKWITETNCFSPSEKYINCGPLKLNFVIKKKMSAEIFLNFHETLIYISRKPRKMIKLKITFEETYIILNYNERNNIFKYNAHKMNEELKSFLNNIDYRINFKIIKIQNSKLDNDISIINDTVYDEGTKDQLRKLHYLSLWNHVEEELVPSYFPTLPRTTLKDFINNSTMYKSSIEFAITRAIKIMKNRTMKYAILLISYAFEAIRISLSLEPYRYQSIENLERLDDALIQLTGNDILSKGYLDFVYVQYKQNAMCILRAMVYKIVKSFLTPEEMEGYSNDLNENNCKQHNDDEKPILPQYLLDKVLNGFPKPHDENEFQNIPVNLRDVMEKLHKINTLIKTEYKYIFKIKFINEKEMYAEIYMRYVSILIIEC
ncbi:uncharacterized protein LOC126908287 [Daktulosphaira vitifoliae]|uniref:uncharacterized protein LOC126908287 n=1 Tax=Daktulosphaira vitifoliae TaxID=58002 RepID=UPI0021A9A1B3|nr:uncharacterized protein LOC126908287 [Daktulosphaira vitifoliae]